MNGGAIRGTALSMDGTARPWIGGYHEWVALDPFQNLDLELEF
jgi:hypothetical protein